MVPLDRPLHGVEQFGPALAVFAGFGVLVEGHPGPVGQQAHRIDEVEVFGLADKGDGVPRCLAPKAVVKPLFGVDAERRALFGVERAQSAPAAPDALEGCVFSNERHDVGGGSDLGDVLVGNGHGVTVPRSGPPRIGLAVSEL